MEELKNKYLLAVIPADTLLFRKAADKKVYESMYFSFNSAGTFSSDHSNEPTQTWRTIRPIISRLIVNDKLSPPKYNTDLEYCYHQFCGEELYYLEIRSRNNPKRKAFLEFLKGKGIDSWVTPVENKMAMELHLFTVENKELVKFKQFINEDKNKILGNKETFDRVVLLDPKEHI